MIDTTTKTALRVSTDGTGGPSFIMLPFSQLDEVQRLLDSGGIDYWVDENVISLNGDPEEAFINFDRGADVAAIQAILDSVP